MKIWHIFSIASLLIAFSSLALADQIYTKEIKNNIEYSCIIKPYAKVHVLKVPLNDPLIEIKPALAYDTIGRLETTSSIAKRYAAIAAVNGSFFDRRRLHLPIGLMIIDGQILTKSSLNRSAFGLTYDKKPVFGRPQMSCIVTNQDTGCSFEIWGINRPRKKSEIILYTSEYGDRTDTNNSGVEIIIENNQVIGIADGDGEIPEDGYVISFHGDNMEHTNKLAPGTTVAIDFYLSDGWNNVQYALTGGPRLIENGSVVVSDAIAQENFRFDILKKHARTAIGTSYDGKLILMTVEGKRSRYKRKRKGVIYSQLAELMKEVGADNAIALDGGGEATMYIAGRVVNRPENGYVQKVSNALIVKYKDS